MLNYYFLLGIIALTLGFDSALNGRPPPETTPYQAAMEKNYAAFYRFSEILIVFCLCASVLSWLASGWQYWRR